MYVKSSNETLDTLRKWDLKIIQGTTGYRFSMDSLLLAAMAHPPHNGKVLDLGAGCGIVSLILAREHPDISITGIEIQPQMAERAKKNVEINGMRERIQIIEGSYGRLAELVPEAGFHYVITNPPYRRVGTGRINPSKEKAIARHELHGGLETLLRASSHALLPKGRLGMIFTPSRLTELLSICRTHGIEAKRIRFIHPYIDHAAQGVFLEGVKDGKKGEVNIEPPLVIYQAPNVYTEGIVEMVGAY